MTCDNSLHPSVRRWFWGQSWECGILVWVLGPLMSCLMSWAVTGRWQSTFLWCILCNYLMIWRRHGLYFDLILGMWISKNYLPLSLPFLLRYLFIFLIFVSMWVCWWTLLAYYKKAGRPKRRKSDRLRRQCCKKNCILLKESKNVMHIVDAIFQERHCATSIIFIWNMH